MKFKILSSEKFDYMMLSRLIQDAKYFINYPELKHLWTHDLNKHIEEMKKQYNKLDPKPEWTSEEEINNLVSQMKEAYKNHWNERHPDNKIEAASSKLVYDVISYGNNGINKVYKTVTDLEKAKQIAQDLFNKIKDDVWIVQRDKNIDSWEQKTKIVFELNKNNNEEEPEKKKKGTYKQGYRDGRYMFKYHHVEDADDIHEKYSEEYERGYWDGVNDEKEKEFYKNSSEQPTTPKPTQTLPDTMTWAWDPKANQWIAVMKDNPVVTPPTYNPNNVNNLNNTTTTQMYTPIKSTLIDSLNQFLDGDKYSREIKIEKGLISDGLIKLAGINPIKGPKYSITDKGLQLLKQAAQEEYDFEKDYINARKSYLLDGISESEFQTGTPEEQGQMPKFSIFEKDGSELAQIEAKNSTDAKVKFIMENPEYEGSQSIEIKEVKASDEDYKLPSTYIDNELTQYHIEKFPSGKWYYWFNNPHSKRREQVGPYNTHDEAVKFLKKHHTDISNPFNEDCLKEIDSTYGETTVQGLDFPNQSVSPSTDIKVDTKGWVNVQSAKLTPQLLSLGGILDPYIKNGSIGLSIEDENKGNISVRGDAKTINTIESKVKDLGIFCNNETLPADEGKGIYTLNIFLED